MQSKPIQVIPANGWFAYYKLDDGPLEKSRIVCIALYDDGDIHFMDVDDSGFIDKIDSAHNLRGVKHEDDGGVV